MNQEKIGIFNSKIIEANESGQSKEEIKLNYEKHLSQIEKDHSFLDDNLRRMSKVKNETELMIEVINYGFDPSTTTEKYKNHNWAMSFKNNTAHIESLLNGIIHDFYGGACSKDRSSYLMRYFYKYHFFNVKINENDFDERNYWMPRSGSPQQWCDLIYELMLIGVGAFAIFTPTLSNKYYQILKRENNKVMNSWGYLIENFKYYINSFDKDDYNREFLNSTPDERFPLKDSLIIEQKNNQVLFNEIIKNVNLLNDNKFKIEDFDLILKIINLVYEIETSQSQQFSKKYKEHKMTNREYWALEEKQKSGEEYNWFCDPFHKYLQISAIKNSILKKLNQLKNRELDE